MKKLSVIFIFAAVLAGCFYDKESELHPKVVSNVCDTTNVTYSNQIVTLVNSYCISCHYSGGVSGYDYSSWNDLHTNALNGQLMGSVQYQPHHPPMPPSFQLDACHIRQLQMWVNAGAPNN